MDDKVWYAAYGSNLSRDRFMCYVRGGRPIGSNRRYGGFLDTSEPAQDRGYKINHEMYFAKNAPSWGGGGVAFIDPTAAAHVNTYGRIYLITWEQFVELVAHENTIPLREVSDRLTPSQLKKAGQSVKIETAGYNLILCLGECEQYPVCTFTHAADLSSERTKPGRHYLRTIVEGLVETYFVVNGDYKQLTDDFVNYLRIASKDEWQSEEICGMIDGCALTVQPTKNRKGAGRSFIVQMHHDQISALGVKRGRPVIIQSRHGDRTLQVLAKVDIPRDGEPESGSINIDQKLREAISVLPDQRVIVKAALPPIEKGWWIGKTFRRFLQLVGGVQPQVMRVTTASSVDMEINLCRIPASSFDVLGIVSGDYVTIESVTGRTRLRALVAINEMVEKRTTQEKNNPDSANTLVSLGADLPLISIDLDARMTLGVKPHDPVYVQRSVSQLLSKQMRYLAMTVVLGGLMFILQLDEPWWQRSLMFAGLLVVGGALVIIEIRNRIT